MLTNSEKKVLSKYLLLLVVLLIHITILFLITEFSFLEKKAMVGSLERKRCENTFSFFADRGTFEFLMKVDGNYEWVAVPKSLCNSFLVNIQTELVIGEITNTVYLAKQSQSGINRNWKLFGALEIFAFMALFLAYLPRVTKFRFGLASVFFIAYIMYRWLVSVL